MFVISCNHSCPPNPESQRMNKFLKVGLIQLVITAVAGGGYFGVQAVSTTSATWAARAVADKDEKRQKYEALGELTVVEAETLPSSRSFRVANLVAATADGRKVHLTRVCALNVPLVVQTGMKIRLIVDDSGHTEVHIQTTDVFVP